MSTKIQAKNTIPMSSAGARLDQVAAELFPDYSRSRIKGWLQSGEMTINGMVRKPNIKVAGGEVLVLDADVHDEGDWQAEPIEFEVIFEDNDIVVINKPLGLVVHPAAGNWSGTLLNGLLYRYPELRTVPRAGVVHRLDKNTTGLMVVAKNIESQNRLVSQLQNRTVKREYEALVWGEPEESGRISAPIGRDPKIRTKMAVEPVHGKPAVTHYEVLEYLEGAAHIRLALETGRTHQIRVHMAHLGFPLIGDDTYGRAPTKSELKANPLSEMFAQFGRQALHAVQLGLEHPSTGEYCQWQVPLADDIAGLLVKVHEQLGE